MQKSNDEALQQARSLLSSIQQQGQDSLLRDSAQAAEALGCSITLLQSFKRSIQAGQGPVPSSPNWTVVRAVLELLVRWGICPNLSPGVGIAREKRSGNSGFLAAATAMFEHLSCLNASDSLLPTHVDKTLAPEAGVLFISAEVLASLVWDNSCTVSAGSGEANTSEAGMSPLGQLVMERYLSDMMAAYLQLAYGPQAGDFTVSEYYKRIASERLNEITETLAVGKVVEASFIILNQKSPRPPEWLKSEVGKRLSRLVMRGGGVGAVLQSLVGGAMKGNVELYDKVAAHLAKIPKSIATADDYYKAVCPQLPPLLFQSPQIKLMKDDAAQRTLSNIYVTSVSMACNMIIGEPKLAEVYLLEPLLRPLLAWSCSQRRMEVANQGLSASSCKEEIHKRHYGGSIAQVTENELVSSLMQINVLLTAGHRSFSSIRKLILLKTRQIAPLLLKLHYQLEAGDGTSSFLAVGRHQKKGNKILQQSTGTIKKDQGNLVSSHDIRGKGLARGFLNEEKTIEEAPEDESVLAKLRFVLADIVIAQAAQPLELALPFASSLLFQLRPSVLRWPHEHGEIWDALNSRKPQTSSSAMYLSKLLLVTENWSLAVALMVALLHKVLNLRRSIMESGVVETHLTEDLLGFMQDFEVLNKEAGTKALEQDARGAALLVKVLLEDESILDDEDIVELALHMVHSMLKGFNAFGEAGGDVQCSSNDRKDSAVLTDILSALQRVCKNASFSEKLRRMSSTLVEAMSSLCCST